MSIILPGLILTNRLDDNAKAAIGDDLKGMAQDLRQEYSAYYRSLTEWWRWYDAEPRVKQKNYPFKDASNVVVPFIKQQVDAAVAHTFNGFAKTDTYWGVRTENELFEGVSNNIARRINWGARGNEFDFLLFIYDFLNQLYVVGSSVAEVKWQELIQPIFFGTGRQSKPQRVLMQRGPSIDYIPRDRIAWDTSYSIWQAPLVVRTHDWTWRDLMKMAQDDPAFDRDAIEVIQGSPDNSWESDHSVDRYHRQTEGSSDLNIIRNSYCVDQLHCDWPMLGRKLVVMDDEMKEALDTDLVPVVAYVHRGTGTLLRLTAEPYHIIGKPFFSSHYKKRPGRDFGFGMSKHLEQIQSIMTTLFNQAIDSQTRANAVFAKTRNARLAKQPIDFAHAILVGDMSEYEAFNLHPPSPMNIGLIQAAQVMGERTTGQADPGMGRETRSGGHPSPATSTLALMEVADTLRTTTERLIRHEIGRMGQSLAILYQQFDTNEDGRLETIFGELDAKEMSKYLFPTEPIPGNFMFDVVPLSATFNPDTQMRRAITVGQMNVNYWSFVLQGTQVIENPQVGPLTKQHWLKAIDSMTRLYSRFLAAADVDDMEKFLAGIKDAGIESQQALQQFAAGAGEIIQGAGAANQPGANGPPANGAGGGTGGPFGGIGVLQ